MTEHGIMRWGDDEPHRFVHAHSDIGGGYCDCGAQRCSFRECDGWCKHYDGWVEKAELDERNSRATAYAIYRAATCGVMPSREFILQLLGLAGEGD